MVLWWLSPGSLRAGGLHQTCRARPASGPLAAGLPGNGGGATGCRAWGGGVGHRSCSLDARSPVSGGGLICVRSPSRQMAQRGPPSHGQPQEAAGGGEGRAGRPGEPWAVSGAGDRAAGGQPLIGAGGKLRLPMAAPPHSRPWAPGWSQMRKLARQRPRTLGNAKGLRPDQVAGWAAVAYSCAHRRQPPARCQLSGPVSPITKGSPGATALEPSAMRGREPACSKPGPLHFPGAGHGGLPASPRAYFLLSSLARQVAASTALMVAARSPPCSRACSP